MKINRVTYAHFRVPHGWAERQSGAPRYIQPYSREKGDFLGSFEGTEPSKYGGKTRCMVFMSNGTGQSVVMTGDGDCSVSDSFCYETGRVVSAADVVAKMVWGTEVNQRTRRVARKLLSLNHRLDDGGAWLSDWMLKTISGDRYELTIDFYEQITNKEWNRGVTPL